MVESMTLSILPGKTQTHGFDPLVTLPAHPSKVSIVF